MAEGRDVGGEGGREGKMDEKEINNLSGVW